MYYVLVYNKHTKRHPYLECCEWYFIALCVSNERNERTYELERVTMGEVRWSFFFSCSGVCAILHK